MGILNVTPDSFFEDSRFFKEEEAIERGVAIYQEGADILDIGGESTRPYAIQVDEKEEMRRVIPVIQELKKLIPIDISIDTMKPRVAAEAVKAGASIINDVSGFSSPEMREVAASTHLPICVMHMQGTPQTMQENPSYPEGIVAHLIKWFENRINLLIKDGIKEKNIILDPGIGFGKTVADNLEIIHNLHKLKAIGFPIAIGFSRKSFIAKLLNKPAKDLLSATIAMNTLAILSEASVIRVHDVRDHRMVIDILKKVFEE